VFAQHNGKEAAMARRRASGRTQYQTELQKAIRKFLPARGLPLVSKDDRVRWTDRMLVITAVLMTWALEPTLQDAFATGRGVVAAMYDSRRRPGRTLGGFLKALARVSAGLIGVVVAALRLAVQRVAGSHWTHRGWVVMGVDGTRINCPRTVANERAFGCAGKAGTTPQILLTMLFHVATGLPWAWHQGPGDGSERADLEAMLDLLPRCTLLLADAGYVGFDMMNSLLGGGQSFIIRVGRNVHLLEELGYAVHEVKGTVYLWPKHRRNQPPLVLRLVRVRSGQQTVALLTNVSAASFSDREVAELYRRRWGIEVLYRSLKQTMQRRQMLSDRPKHAALELDWAVVGLWLLGLMTAEAASRGGRPPRSWSLAQAQRVVRQAMRRLGKPRPAGGLRWQLRRAVKDTYVRRHPKAARYWPRKKTERPPGVPKIRTATREEIRMAQAFHQCTAPN
jgi:hypothetical protein